MQACHYCKTAVGNTDDHIVARSLLPKKYPNALPMKFHQGNRVPSCGPCNNAKGRLKTDCSCKRCTLAWSLAREYLEPLGWTEPPVITVEDILVERLKHLKAMIMTNMAVIVQENEVVDIRTEYPDWPYDD